MPNHLLKTSDGYQLETEIQLKSSLHTVFDFFADASNLDQLTPKWLHFQIITPQPIAMREGTLIDYRLRLHGIPIHWKTKITVWEPPYRFVDEQIQGPYRRWIHEHTFSKHGDVTLVGDSVRYAVPGGPLVHWLFVKRDVERIFQFRQQTLAALYGSK